MRSATPLTLSGSAGASEKAKPGSEGTTRSCPASNSNGISASNSIGAPGQPWSSNTGMPSPAPSNAQWWSPSQVLLPSRLSRASVARQSYSDSQ